MAKFNLSEETYAELFDLKASTRHKTMLNIAQAAIRSYATLGFDKTTYESIAKISNVSRPLVHKYFPDKREIFLLAIKYVRLELQKLAISAIGSAKSPTEMLKAYVDATFEWIKKQPEHVVVWMLFLYQTTIDPELKQMSTEVSRVGHERISNLLRLGAESGVFKITNVSEQAKQIQGVINGVLLMSVSESHEPMHSHLQKRSVETCLRIAGHK